MARVKVWIEAQEEYLINHNLGKRESLKKLSDDELREYYYKAIEKNGLAEDAEKFIHRWCMQYK